MNTTFTLATEQDLIDLRKAGGRGYYHDQKLHKVPANETPWEDGYPDFGIPQPWTLEYSHVSGKQNNYWYTWKPNRSRGEGETLPHEHIDQLKADPFFLYIHTKRVYGTPPPKAFQPNETLQALASTAQRPKLLLPQNDGRYRYDTIDDAGMISVSVAHQGVRFLIVLPFGLAEYAFGLQITEDFKLLCNNGAENDFPAGWKNQVLHKTGYRGDSYRSRDRLEGFDYTFDTIPGVRNFIPMNNENLTRFIRGLVKEGVPFPELKTSGIKKTMNRLDGASGDLLEKDPLAFVSYRTLSAHSKRSVDGVKLSTVFNEIFKEAQTAEDIIVALKDFYKVDGDEDIHKSHNVDEACRRLDMYKTKRKAVLKSQANRAFTKVMQEAESLSIDKKKYKRTWKEIEEGNLPIGTFFRKQEQYFLLNDCWALWEEMFKRGYRDQAIALANEVKGRTTYEKDLMSYLYFVLYSLPAYLKKHTGCKWECVPKLVNTQDELEPPKEDDDSGITRKRSALTPIADNEAKRVEVPYASLCIYGYRQNTYCYSHTYNVLTKGFSFNGNAVMEDLEKCLNGRDDYGLMFYTLTGSVQGRGYPTFLIIFERRTGAGDTRVHFHRIHPSRSKDGDYNPIHNWIKVCYNWMAGNIKRDRIKAQQGDLAFVQIKTEKTDDSLDGAAVTGLEFDHKVNEYDKHCFEKPVKFAEYTKKAKSNVLGYVDLDEDTWIRHTEHDDVLIPQGKYAIHQCRSWEANPKGVWSLRID